MTSGWPRYSVRRIARRADVYDIEVCHPSGAPVLSVAVQLFCTPRSRVSAKALHPASVRFEVDETPYAVPEAYGPQVAPIGAPMLT